MTDPFEALREPVVPVAPDPQFAARLRERLTRAVLDQGETMTTHTTHTTRSAPPDTWSPTMSPYLVVSDTRTALDWYADVFGGRRRGEPFVNADGTIGHAEMGIGDAVLMLSDASDLYPDVPVRAPDSPTTFSQSLHLRVPDVDAVVAKARRTGATVEREPADQFYGRNAVIVDPFGHRWLLNRLPGDATRLRQGDIVRVSMVTPDADRAREFYEAVLQVPFTAGGTPGAWAAETEPAFGMWSPPEVEPEVQPCFRVDDIDAAVTRVRGAGGLAGQVDRGPHGLLAECEDDQGAHFQLWQPVD
jgi:uncharacterized glyoxalase superfamily protein PhnB